MRLFMTLLFLLCLMSQETYFEKTQGKSNVPYQELINFYKQLEKEHAYIQVKEIGSSDYQIPLHTVVLSSEKIFSANDLKDQVVLFVLNGIHSGESDGVDASQLLIRDMLIDMKSNPKKYNGIVAVFIPVYNIGGYHNRSPYNRANQNGPSEMGFRGNARNLDLNRDFIKMDSQNAWAITNAFTEWQAHVFIDNHVTNGADYQYVITYTITETAHGNPHITDYVKKTFKPFFESKMKQASFPVSVYVEMKKRGDLNAGLDYFYASPRYSTGYTDQHQSISILNETHMLKPYKQRVEGSYQLMKITMEIMLKDKNKILTAKKNAELSIQSMKEFPIQWKQDEEKFDRISFFGYEYSMEMNSLFGFPIEKYHRDKKKVYEIPLYNVFIPTKSISIPKFYLIPQQWTEIISRLKNNHVEMSEIQEDMEMDCDVYRIQNPKWSNQPFEGRFLLQNFETTLTKEKQKVRKGDILIPSNQKAYAFIMQVLEPEATDSYLRWGFFNIIFQQKEYFSPYLFVDKINEMLKTNPNLQKEYEEFLEKNPDVQKNPFAKMNFFYLRSEYYEKHSHLKYPVYRIQE